MWVVQMLDDAGFARQTYAATIDSQYCENHAAGRAGVDDGLEWEDEDGLVHFSCFRCFGEDETMRVSTQPNGVRL